MKTEDTIIHEFNVNICTLNSYIETCIKLDAQRDYDGRSIEELEMIIINLISAMQKNAKSIGIPASALKHLKEILKNVKAWKFECADKSFNHFYYELATNNLID